MCCAAAALWTFVHDREGVSQRELPTERERKRVRERTKESDCCCMLACLDLEQKNQEEGDVGEMEVALKRCSGLLCTMRECAPTERVNCMHVYWVGVNRSVHASGHALVHAACCYSP